MSPASVVVTGAGVLLPEAWDLATFEGRLGAWAGSEQRIDLDAATRLRAGQARRLDRASQILWCAAKEAAGRARLAEIDGERVGLVVGTALGCLEKTEEQLRGMARAGLDHLDPLGFADSMDNAPAAHTAIDLGVRGPSYTLREREISGESAFLTAASLLESQAADAVVVVAGDATSALGALLCRGIDPDLVPLEGAGAVVLESLPTALRRAAPLLARVAGRARVSGAQDEAAPQARLRALAQAGLDGDALADTRAADAPGRTTWLPADGILRVIRAILVLQREGKPVLVLKQARGGGAVAIVLAPPA